MLPFDETRTVVVRGLESFAARLDALDEQDWDRRTRCPGWRVRDVAWHLAWGEGPGEVIRAAREGSGGVEYATSRMGSPPATDEIQGCMHEKAGRTRTDLNALGPDDADLVVRYGRGDPGRPLLNYLWGVLVEVVVHGDDLACALGTDEPAQPHVAAEIVRGRVHGAVGWASQDGLQPVAPRGYRLTGESLDTGFFYRDGSWREGIDESVPTCTFTSDNTTLMRVVMGRIPASPFESAGRWDDRLKLSGEVRVASPFDFMRWCYGAW